jgi:hypothetical protein
MIIYKLHIEPCYDDSLLFSNKLVCWDYAAYEVNEQVLLDIEDCKDTEYPRDYKDFWDCWDYNIVIEEIKLK